jgi:hypothetical protein
MIVVIQCAARKQAAAGHLRADDGKRVVFVADPTLVQPEEGLAYARPDDLCDSGKSWREVLLEYNSKKDDNPFRLCPAYQLYQHRIYDRLVDRFGIEKTSNGQKTGTR